MSDHHDDHDHPEHPRVLHYIDLLHTVEALKAQGKTVVTTNGCFDLVHAGHIGYLQAAKDFGDVLIVLLNSDASVKRLKGPTRPIVSEDDRALLLAELRCVDYVSIFEEDSPAGQLRDIKSHVHVKGGQYTEETLPEAPVLRAAGTKMAFIPMTEGRSTSQIIERILATQSQPTPSA